MFATLAMPAAAGAFPGPRSRTVCVRSADELRRALRESQHVPVSVDATGLDRVLRLEDGRDLLEVQAATPWRALAGHLGARGAALAAFARTPGLPASVGEAVSSNPAGPDGRPIAAHVDGITLVTADGELRRASRDGNAALFRLALGGQGVFGVLYSVTLRLDSLLQAAEQALAPVLLEVPGAPAPGLACAIDVLVPPARLEEFLAAARALAQEHRLALESVQVRRLLPEVETALNWANREWAGVALRFAIRATLGASVHALEARRMLLGAALACGGSFPITGTPDATRGQLEACYPGLRAFLAEKRRYDPGERLQNDWYRHITGLLRREPCESRWALSD